MRIFLLSLCYIFLSSVSVLAQINDNTYRSNKNPLYWQNRKPDAAYWQQDVHYAISVKIDENANSIEGGEVLDYWNNSPDTLTYLFFHLFQNAFIKGSHLHDLEKANNVQARLGKRESEGLGTLVDNITIDGQRVRAETDNTVMKVYLNRPLVPNQKLEISIQFKTFYDRGTSRRRMQMYPAWGFMHYNGVQWFPKICVYDRKFGWDTYQHLNKEFYGDFGSYDVSLDFPSNYVVEATGMLTNKNDVLPDTLMAKLDIKNFAHKKWNEDPSIITPYKKGERKVWQYHADNVHDFAFTADPSYRIGTTTWEGIQCVAIAQEPHASGWQNGAEYVAKIIKTFSEDIGHYEYPKMVAADANDGMEYPMLTLDGGSNPGYHGLLVHEIGHNWFYGMVGSNETYRAAMDEGFTQFLTAWGLRRIDGENDITTTITSKYKRHFAEPVNILDRNVENVYCNDALNKNEVQLNTHSDDFNGALNHDGGYRLVYFKTATMLYNLQYTLGDSLFKSAMQHYFQQWKIGHPYFEDFKASIIQYTHVDLNWFFDEWFETTKTIDYGITKIKNLGDDNYAIKFRRTGEMQMPIDFTITATDKKQYRFTIPNTWFAKTGCGLVLPKWYGWGKLYPTYTAKIQVPGGIHSVQIDPTYRLADKDEVDNYKTKGLGMKNDAVKWKLDGGTANPTDRRHYRMYVRPDVWWNAVDGVKAGIHFEGNYMNTLNKVDAAIWFNTHLLQGSDYKVASGEGQYNRYVPVNFTLNYSTPVTRSMPKLQVQVNTRLLDGLWYNRLGLNWAMNEKNTVQLSAQSMWRQMNQDWDYLLYPTEWSSTQGHANTSINAAWTHRYNYIQGAGAYTFSFRTPFLTGTGSDAFNYSYGQVEAINYNRIAKLNVRTRVFGRYGMGNNVPNESALFLAGANPEELMDNKYTRSVGIVPDDWRGISRYDMNHFQQGGGLNLRGFAGYYIADERDGAVLAGYKGQTGASASVEVDFNNYIPLHPRFTKWLHADMYAFGDVGLINLSRYALPNYTVTENTSMLSDVRIDAGLGMALTIRSWGVFEKAKPLTLRIDMPFFVNRPAYGNPEYLAVRWVVGVNRSF